MTCMHYNKFSVGIQVFDLFGILVVRSAKQFIDYSNERITAQTGSCVSDCSESAVMFQVFCCKFGTDIHSLFNIIFKHI